MTSNANSSDTIRVRDKVLMRVMAKMVQIYNGVVEKLKKWTTGAWRNRRCDAWPFKYGTEQHRISPRLELCFCRNIRSNAFNWCVSPVTTPNRVLGRRLLSPLQSRSFFFGTCALPLEYCESYVPLEFTHAPPQFQARFKSQILSVGAIRITTWAI